MKVVPQKVVSVSYTLTDDGGEVVDIAEEAEPMIYLHGAGQLIPGVESALDGRGIGDEIEVDLSPEEGYGEYEEELRMDFPRELFAELEEESGELEIGQELEIELDGVELLVTVEEIGEEAITVDANHELAGLGLHFAGKVLAIRDATPEEIEHGHAHFDDASCDDE